MDKLQWFKFVPSDWMMGKIQRCPEITQARFIRLSCLYWNKECTLSLEDAEIEIDSKHLDILISKKIIKVVDNLISIQFLNEQLVSILETSKDKSKAAKVRWNKHKCNADAMHVHKSAMHNDADKIRLDKDKIRLDKDKEEFAKAVNDYGQCMKLTSAKELWDDMSDEEKEKAIIHIPKFRKKYEDEEKIEYLYDFFTYLKEKMYTIEIKKTTINNIQYPTL